MPAEKTPLPLQDIANLFAEALDEALKATDGSIDAAAVWGFACIVHFLRHEGCYGGEALSEALFLLQELHDGADPTNEA